MEKSREKQVVREEVYAQLEVTTQHPGVIVKYAAKCIHLEFGEWRGLNDIKQF